MVLALLSSGGQPNPHSTHGHCSDKTIRRLRRLNSKILFWTPRGSADAQAAQAQRPTWGGAPAAVVAAARRPRRPRQRRDASSSGLRRDTDKSSQSTP
jgi:hypothetical protein